MDDVVGRNAVALTDPEATTRAQAARSLAHSQSPLHTAILPLIRAAGDRDDEVRMWAAEALEMAGAPQASDVGSLAELLTSETDGEIAYWASTCLGRLGPQAAPAVDALLETLVHSSYLPVRERAAWALARIGPAARAAAPALQALTDSGYPRLSRLAISALESIRGMAA
ncbi:MAG: HEAT repeat domain-containing protein [Pirellulaceae bacterium]